MCQSGDNRLLPEKHWSSAKKWRQTPTHSENRCTEVIGTVGLVPLHIDSGEPPQMRHGAAILLSSMIRLLFSAFSKRPPVSTGAVTSVRTLPPDSDGSLTTMAKGVNDVLNYYIQVTDTKASIFIAGSVASASFLLMKFPVGTGPQVLYVVAAASLGAALVLATLVVMPRLPAFGGKGSVFWGDIAGCSSAVNYRDRFGQTASAGLLDEEYSVLNFYTSRILGRKIRILRSGILCFLAGVLTALPHHLINA